MTTNNDTQATIPTDEQGKPLAWPAPSGDGWVDAWNGWYEDETAAIGEADEWTASVARRVLAFGEGLITADEAERRLLALDVAFFEILVDEVRSILDEPPTDDPVDTLRAIARAVEYVEDDYDYFDNKGQWVLYPQEGS